MQWYDMELPLLLLLLLMLMVAVVREMYAKDGGREDV